jgi:Protein of unknown function (DUF3300)
MNKKMVGARLRWEIARSFLAVLCAALLIPGDASSLAQSPQAASPAEQEEPKLPPEQLDSLVAPIALYPDPLLAQVLVASTYPLEIMQLQQWLIKHKDLKDKALNDAVIKQPWDPSIQGMAALPDAVKRLADDIQWTTELGNAFLAQQSDVMDAVQRMRAKAEGTGNLKSNEQMKVETKIVENKSIVVIEQAKPEVVYVPSYDPVVVYGAPAYPYPPIAYPPPGYYAAGMAVSFGVGMMVGAAINGGWGYNSGWGGGNNNVNINNNNNFVNNSNRTSNRQNVGNGNRSGGGNSWQHNPQHRGGTPYSNKGTANKFGGTARGDSMSNRQSNARQNQAGAGNRAGGGAGGADRAGNRASGGAGGGDRAGNRASGGAGGGDRVGNRSTSGGSKGGGNALGGSSRSGSGSGARASSSRGSSSMGGSRGGGGGGRSGGGGGGRRR